MLKEVSGDILLTRAQALAHGVAPGDNFASGLAHSLRESWPAMYKDFRHYCQTRHPKPGELWAWMGSDGRQIVGLFTQQPPRHVGDHPGRATLEAVNHCLRELGKFAVKENIRSIALPRIATGVGGLDWAHVWPAIQRHLGELAVPVYVYTTFRAGEVAAEE